MSWTRAYIPAGPDSRVELLKTEPDILAIVSDRNLLLRHPNMELFYERIITEVRDSARYCGIIYLMYSLDDTGKEIPLYVGKAERYGRNREISRNLTNKEFFGRWGYPKFYHIGDLSRALQVLAKTGKPAGSHSEWASKLFKEVVKGQLKRQVYFWALPWTHQDRCPCGAEANVAELENCLIRHAKRFFTSDNLNKQRGRDSCRCR